MRCGVVWCGAVWCSFVLYGIELCVVWCDGTCCDVALQYRILRCGIL